MRSDNSWRKICEDYEILSHDFTQTPYRLTSGQIKTACRAFVAPSEKEAYILCKQDGREDRPHVFRDNGLFVLPVKNGEYAVVKGEGYVDIPKIQSAAVPCTSRLSFIPDTFQGVNSKTRHLDFAYASSVIRDFVGDDTLVLVIRGRRFTPRFSFVAGDHRNDIEAKSVQTTIDAGYEGATKMVLVIARNAVTDNIIIRQLYYPYRQWQQHTDKPVHLLFFEKRAREYCVWEFVFADRRNYNSVRCVNSARFSLSAGV